MMNLLVLWESSSQRLTTVGPVYSWKTRQWFMCCVEWVKVSILPTVERIVCRTSNRVVVGAPLCAWSFVPQFGWKPVLTPYKGRDRDYQMMIMGHVENLIMSAFIISSFPEFLKPCVTRAASRASLFFFDSPRRIYVG